MLHSVKTLMLVGLLMLLPVAANAAAVRKTPEPVAGGWVAAGELDVLPSIHPGRGPSIDPAGDLRLLDPETEALDSPR